MIAQLLRGQSGFFVSLVCAYEECGCARCMFDDFVAAPGFIAMLIHLLYALAVVRFDLDVFFNVR